MRSQASAVLALQEALTFCEGRVSELGTSCGQITFCILETRFEEFPGFQHNFL